MRFLNIFHRGWPALVVGFLAFAAVPTANALTSDMVFIGHARGYSSVKAININTGKEVPFLEFKTNSQRVAISPDERMLTWKEGKKVFLFDHATQKKSTLFTDSGDIGYSFVNFLPKGELLYTKSSSNEKSDALYKWGSEGGGSVEYWTYSFKTGQHQRLTKKDAEWLFRGALSPDGKYKLLFPENTELGHGGEGSAVKNIKPLLMSSSSTKELELTGLGKTKPWNCSNASFSPKSSNAFFDCHNFDASYTTLYPLQVKKGTEGYRRDYGVIQQAPQWISEEQAVFLTEDEKVKDIVSQDISIINWSNADPDLYKTIATTTDVTKKRFGEIVVRSQNVLFVENTIQNNDITSSRLLRYNLSTGKTVVVLKSQPRERLSLQRNGKSLYLFGIPR